MGIHGGLEELPQVVAGSLLDCKAERVRSELPPAVEGIDYVAGSNYHVDMEREVGLGTASKEIDCTGRTTPGVYHRPVLYTVISKCIYYKLRAIGHTATVLLGLLPLFSLGIFVPGDSCTRSS